MNIKTIILSASFVMLASNLSHASTHNVDLELLPNKGMERVKLPFQYAHLNKNDKKNIKFIPERFYTVLEDNSNRPAA